MTELEGLGREFNGRTAVEGLTFRVEEGEIFGLLGPNGAGETTTVRMLCSLIRPTRRRARVCGHDVVEEAERVREMVGLLPNPGLYQELSTYENLEFHARLHGCPTAGGPERPPRPGPLLPLRGGDEDGGEDPCWPSGWPWAWPAPGSSPWPGPPSGGRRSSCGGGSLFLGGVGKGGGWEG